MNDFCELAEIECRQPVPPVVYCSRRVEAAAAAALRRAGLRFADRLVFA